MWCEREPAGPFRSGGSQTTRGVVTVEVDCNGLELLSMEECWRILEAHHVGRLAVGTGGPPEVFPLNYALDNSSDPPGVVFLTSPGTKLASMAARPEVAFELDGSDPLCHTGWSVVVHGHAKELQDAEEILAAEALPLRPWVPNATQSYVRLEVDSVTGRRIP